MEQRFDTTRRDFLVGAATVGAAACVPVAFAQATLPQRAIPRTGELLPVIGLGSSKVVSEVAARGAEPLTAVLRALADNGGKLVDTWPRNAANDGAFGRVINSPELRDRLFITTKIDQVGKDVGIRQFRETQRLYGRETLDLVQIFSLTDADTHWPSLKEWQAEGAARYVGVTVSEPHLHDALAEFIRRERPDFVQMNYSITERAVEQRLLPLAADSGVAVLINRPFMNGAYFDRLEGQPLPEWAAEFGCTSWAQFSLKYILAHPALTCVLTETSNPAHMEENLHAAVGPLPDATALQRMRDLIERV